MIVASSANLPGPSPFAAPAAAAAAYLRSFPRGDRGPHCGESGDQTSVRLVAAGGRCRFGHNRCMTEITTDTVAKAVIDFDKK